MILLSDEQIKTIDRLRAEYADAMSYLFYEVEVYADRTPDEPGDHFPFVRVSFDTADRIHYYCIREDGRNTLYRDQEGIRE
jgi:hypothetical protein